MEIIRGLEEEAKWAIGLVYRMFQREKEAWEEDAKVTNAKMEAMANELKKIRRENGETKEDGRGSSGGLNEGKKNTDGWCEGAGRGSGLRCRSGQLKRGECWSRGLNEAQQRVVARARVEKRKRMLLIEGTLAAELGGDD